MAGYKRKKSGRSCVKVQKQPLLFLILNTKRTPSDQIHRQFVFALKSYWTGVRWNVAWNVIPDVAFPIYVVTDVARCVVFSMTPKKGVMWSMTPAMR